MQIHGVHETALRSPQREVKMPSYISLTGLPIIVIATLFSRGVSAANILCLLTTPTPSHHIWTTPLVQGLAAKGHNVTVVSPTALKTPVPNVTDLVIEGALEVPEQEYDYEISTRLTSYEWLLATFDWYLQSCTQIVKTKGVRQLYDYPDDFKFDLIIIEATGGECLLGFVEKFGRPPLLAINGFGNPQWLNWNMGNPDNPAYVSNFQLTLHWPFSFWEKIKNVAMYIATLYKYYIHYLPECDRILKEYFGSMPWMSRVPPVSDTLNNVTMVLVNAHYSVDGARPMVPAVVPIGGMHIRPPKPLPKDLQQWLDGASETDGAVLFSLGSLVRSSALGKRQLQEIMSAFAAMPKVRFLWKWEKDEPPAEVPPNVRLGKWLPQNDILAHPKLKAFISHAGLLSTHEATWRGVPVVALPFIVDQYLNAGRLQALGVAERLDYATLTKQKMVDALGKVLGDPRYRTRMQQASSLFRSRPSLPLDEALFWVEHVLQHRGAPRIRCASADLPWYALWLIDVAAVAVVVATTLVMIPWALVRRTRPGRKTKEE